MATTCRKITGKLATHSLVISAIFIIELLKEYSKSLAFILGSRTECQPLVILDAMASGTPYISRSTGCIDLIPGGIAVKNEEKAARSLDKILENEEAWKIFHIKGLKAARTDYKYKTVCERLNSAIGEIYKKL